MLLGVITQLHTTAQDRCSGKSHLGTGPERGAEGQYVRLHGPETGDHQSRGAQRDALLQACRAGLWKRGVVLKVEHKPSSIIMARKVGAGPRLVSV